MEVKHLCTCVLGTQPGCEGLGPTGGEVKPANEREKGHSDPPAASQHTAAPVLEEQNCKICQAFGLHSKQSEVLCGLLLVQWFLQVKNPHQQKAFHQGREEAWRGTWQHRTPNSNQVAGKLYLIFSPILLWNVLQHSTILELYPHC